MRTCLSKEEVKNLSRFAKSFNLQVILEIHSEDELYICDFIDVVGVNIKFKKFETDINNSNKPSRYDSFGFFKNI